MNMQQLGDNWQLCYDHGDRYLTLFRSRLRHRIRYDLSQAVHSHHYGFSQLL